MDKSLRAFVTLWLILCLLVVSAGSARAGNIKCGADTTGAGLINQINDCTAGTPFATAGITPTPTVANSNLCPISETNCSLRQWRCDGDTATKGLNAPIYGDQASCTDACSWTAACTSAPITKTITGSGTGSICVDDWLQFQVLDIGGGTKFELALQDLGSLSSTGQRTPHWNCEPPGVNTMTADSFYLDPLSGSPWIHDGWHILSGNLVVGDRQPVAVDFGYSQSGQPDPLPPSNGLDTWNRQVHFCVGAVYAKHNVDCSNSTNPFATNCINWQCVDDVDQIVGSQWDPDSGPSVWNFAYKYTITISNNDYTCPVDPTGTCKGSAGSIVTGGATTPDTVTGSLSTGTVLGSVGVFGGNLLFSNYNSNSIWQSGAITSAGCTFSGSVSAGWFQQAIGSGNAITFSSDHPVGSITLTGCTASGSASITGAGHVFDTVDTSGNSINFYSAGVNVGSIALNVLTTAYNPGVKTCSKVGTCNPEPVCPSGYGCDCTNGVSPTCPDNGIFDPTVDSCLLSAASLCPAGSAWDTVSKGCLVAPKCPAGGVFDTTANVCTAPITITCAAGYSYNTSSAKCEETLPCPSGTTWNASLQMCATNSPVCPIGYGYDQTTNICFLPAGCSTGTYVSAENVCEYPPACPPGSPYALNSVDGTCAASVTCPTGTTYDSALNACSAPYCPVGTTLVSGVCVAVYSCLAGTTFSSGNCTVAATCPTGTTLNMAMNVCQ